VLLPDEHAATVSAVAHAAATAASAPLLRLILRMMLLLIVEVRESNEKAGRRSETEPLGLRNRSG
jgi:hypothetical protein